MNYPAGFPPHLTAPVDTAIADAEIAFANNKRGVVNVERHLVVFIKSIYVAFCYAVCQAVYEGHWTAERARQEFRDHLRQLTNFACYEKLNSAVDSTRERVQREVKHEVETSGEWEKIQRALKGAVEKQEQVKRDAEFQAQQEQSKPVSKRGDSKIGQKIKRFREEARLTLQQLADLMDLDIRNVQRHESGETRSIRKANIIEYERVLSKELKQPISLEDDSP